MRRNLLFKNLGVAVAVAAFAFIACDDSSSGPVVPDAITSSETNGLPGSSNSNPVSSSDVDGSSSSVMVQCNAFMPGCGLRPRTAISPRNGAGTAMRTSACISA